MRINLEGIIYWSMLLLLTLFVAALAFFRATPAHAGMQERTTCEGMDTIKRVEPVYQHEYDGKPYTYNESLADMRQDRTVLVSRKTKKVELPPIPKRVNLKREAAMKKYRELVRIRKIAREMRLAKAMAEAKTDVCFGVGSEACKPSKYFKPLERN